MKNKLYRATILIAFASHQTHSFAHDSVLTHSHEWHTPVSLIGIGIVSMLLITLGRRLKR